MSAAGAYAIMIKQATFSDPGICVPHEVFCLSESLWLFLILSFNWVNSKMLSIYISFE